MQKINVNYNLKRVVELLKCKTLQKAVGMNKGIIEPPLYVFVMKYWDSIYVLI